MAGLGIKGRKVVVVGANASGIATTRFLVRRGALTKLVDPRLLAVIQPTVEKELDLSKFTLECGEYHDKTFEEAQLIVVSPGEPLDSRQLEASRTAGVQVVSELEFVSLFIEEPILAVAGTNGKSTTANMLTKMIEADGRTAVSNVNHPLSAYLNQVKPVDFVVAIADSFQLEGISSFKPKGILFLNLSEDQAHRYPNFETYLSANREVLRNADAETTLVLNAQDAHILAFTQNLTGHKYLFTSEVLPEGIEGASSTKLQANFRLAQAPGQLSLDLKNFRLRGAHNRENLMAASLMALSLGVKPEAIKQVVEVVSALPHRVEFVRRINSVAFYDDSCSVNVNSVLRTLQAFNEPVILISGGRDKNADYSGLIPHIRQRVKNLILVGEAKEKLNRAIGDFTETFLVGTLEEAVILAYQKSRSGDVILFSPGCDASDMFTNLEEKGDYFRRLVSQIAMPRRPNVI